MADLGKLTMIVPVLERQQNIPIFMKHHKDWNCKKIIADSSQQPYSGRVDEDFEYLYYGPVVFFDKVLDLLSKHVGTEYVFLTSDDDIAIADSVSKCIETLERNRQFSFCNGEWYWYRNGSLVVNHNLDGGFVKHLNDQFSHANPAERIRHYFSHYYPAMNSIVRTDVMRHVFGGMVGKRFHISNFGDRAFPLFALMRGDAKALDVPFIVQKYSDRVWGSKKHGQRLLEIYKDVHISLEDTLSDAGLAPFANDIAGDLRMSPGDALKFLRDVFTTHYANEHRRYDTGKPYSYKLFSPAFTAEREKALAFMREVDRNLVRDSQNL